MSSDLLLEAARLAGVTLPPLPTMATHNGKFTVRSTATGAHRTFQVRTWKSKNKRVLSLLTGPDNNANYTGFAFVEGDEIVVWQRKRTEQYVRLANMLMRMQEHVLAGKIEVFAETRCRCCNRTLTTPESVISGLGPICGGR